MAQQVDRADLEARILDHAELQLLREGYRGMRVDELARAVGISKRTLYEQLRTKEDMAREALARRLARLHADIDQVRKRGADAPTQLREIVTLIWRSYAEARPAFYRDVEASPALRELDDRARRRSATKLDAIIRAGIQAGCFRAELDARLLRRTLLAAVDALVRSQLLSEHKLSAPQVAAILELILRGAAAV